MTSLGVKCSEGFNGGLSQSFMLEVRDMNTQVINIFRLLFARKDNRRDMRYTYEIHPIVSSNSRIVLQEIKANYSSPVARFAVSNLHPGNLYILSIYAFNGKGRSEPAVLQAAMLRLPEKQLTSEKGEYTASTLICR